VVVCVPEEPEAAFVELDVDVCEFDEPVPAVDEPFVLAEAFEEPELLEPMLEVAPWLPEPVLLLPEVVDVWVPDEPEPVDVEVEVEFCEPVDPALFDEPVCVDVEPEFPWLDPVALVDVLEFPEFDIVEVWVEVDAPWLAPVPVDWLPAEPCVELVVV
jgi:hypothetical protein